MLIKNLEVENELIGVVESSLKEQFFHPNLSCQLKGLLQSIDISLTCLIFFKHKEALLLFYTLSLNSTLFTCMHVLLQRKFHYGLLWCDEGVYRIAKELQLLSPGNIFLGLGFLMDIVIIHVVESF